MFEAEINRAVASSAELPADVRRQLSEFRHRIASRSLLPWGEHCTECAWPTCYSTCELYSPRLDGDCRLFADGMVRVDLDDASTPYLIKVTFKRWGKLWSIGNMDLVPFDVANRKERSHVALGGLAQAMPVPKALKVPVLRKMRYLRRRGAEDALARNGAPDFFVLECYNPNGRALDATLTLRSREGQSPAFQRRVALPPGFTREKVPVSDIRTRIDTSKPFDIEIVPNEAENIVLYFGLMDFVKEHPSSGVAPSGAETAAPAAKKWKCIVWDLDNTLWDGTAIEDGADRLRLRHEVVDIIKQMDQRGILHSIASKNNHDDAMQILQSLGIDEYFLYPQINWEPKSVSISRIASLLNIGIDTIAFVDDQPFEREQVKAALPRVAIVDAADCLGIPARAECQGSVTPESQQRRTMYRQEQQRREVLDSYQDDYLRFLKDCNITLNVVPLDDGNLERVYELAQRTNQMNFSGTRYPRARLEEIKGSNAYETYVMTCSDRFGTYGAVGFAVIDRREPRLLDLMFSCRIQGKHVEHAFLGFVLKRFVDNGTRDFFANYRPTPQNAPSAKVFDEMGFERTSELDGLLSLVFHKDRAIRDDGVINIVAGRPD